MRLLSLEGEELNLSYMKGDAGCAFEALSKARAVVVWPAGAPWFDQRFAKRLSKQTYVLDAGIGAILPDGIAEAQRRGCLLLRVDIWPALTGTLSAAHDSLMKTSDALGWEILDGIPVVAGGAMGQSGDVIVDSVHHPTRVIGVCDGKGGVRFRFSNEDAERVRQVQTEINRRLVAPQLTGTGARSDVDPGHHSFHELQTNSYSRWRSLQRTFHSCRAGSRIRDLRGRQEPGSTGVESGRSPAGDRPQRL